MEEVSPIQGLTCIPTHSHLILSASKQCRSLSTGFMEMTVMGGACPISDLFFLRRMKQVSWIVSYKGGFVVVQLVWQGFFFCGDCGGFWWFGCFRGCFRWCWWVVWARTQHYNPELELVILDLSILTLSLSSLTSAL